MEVSSGPGASRVGHHGWRDVLDRHLDLVPCHATFALLDGCPDPAKFATRSAVLLSSRRPARVGRDSGSPSTHSAPDQVQRVRFRYPQYRNRARPVRDSGSASSAQAGDLGATLHHPPEGQSQSLAPRSVGPSRTSPEAGSGPGRQLTEVSDVYRAEVGSRSTSYENRVMNPRLRKLRSISHENANPAATKKTDPTSPVAMLRVGSGLPART